MYGMVWYGMYVCVYDRLISDIIEMCDILDILVTMDIKKAFDSLNHDFL